MPTTAPDLRQPCAASSTGGWRSAADGGTQHEGDLAWSRRCASGGVRVGAPTWTDHHQREAARREEGQAPMTIRTVTLLVALLAASSASGQTPRDPTLPPTRTPALIAWLQAATYQSLGWI